MRPEERKDMERRRDGTKNGKKEMERRRWKEGDGKKEMEREIYREIYTTKRDEKKPEGKDVKTEEERSTSLMTLPNMFQMEENRTSLGNLGIQGSQIGCAFVCQSGPCQRHHFCEEPFTLVLCCIEGFFCLCFTNLYKEGKEERKEGKKRGRRARGSRMEE